MSTALRWRYRRLNMFEAYILILQLLTIGTGLFCLRRRGPVLLWIVWTIRVLACINENILVPHVKDWWGISRNVCYNIYAVVDTITWALIFIIIFIKYSIAKKLVVYISLFLILSKIIEINMKGIQQIASVSLILFCGACMVASVCYFAKILNPDFHDLKTDPAFWICCASLSFHSVLMVNLITVPYTAYWTQNFSTVTFNIIQVIAITCYNIFICLSFIFSTSRYSRYFRQISY